MRLFAMAALTAIGLGLVATSGAYAAPINATSIEKAAGTISPLTTVQYYRHRYYRPYYYGYRPIIIGPTIMVTAPITGPIIMGGRSGGDHEA